MASGLLYGYYWWPRTVDRKASRPGRQSSVKRFRVVSLWYLIHGCGDGIVAPGARKSVARQVDYPQSRWRKKIRRNLRREIELRPAIKFLLPWSCVNDSIGGWPAHHTDVFVSSLPIALPRGSGVPLEVPLWLCGFSRFWGHVGS